MAKSGQILAGVILGMSIGSLFGIVYALSRDSLPGNHDIQKTIILAGVMWLSIYLVPFLKYPANPPTVGDGDTVVLRSILYLTFIAISGLSVVGFYKLSQKLEKNKKLLAIMGYGVFISVVFVMMPENPDKITAPMDLVNEFRIMSALGVTSFWVSIGMILGIFWNHFKPHKEGTSFR